MDWKAINQAQGLGIAPEDIERFEPVLNEIYEGLRPLFENDLSTVEPVGSFRPDGR